MAWVAAVVLTWVAVMSKAFAERRSASFWGVISAVGADGECEDSEQSFFFFFFGLVNRCGEYCSFVRDNERF